MLRPTGAEGDRLLLPATVGQIDADPKAVFLVSGCPFGPRRAATEEELRRSRESDRETAGFPGGEDEAVARLVGAGMHAGRRIESAVERLVDDEVLIAHRGERQRRRHRRRRRLLPAAAGRSDAAGEQGHARKRGLRRRPPVQGTAELQRVLPPVSKLSKKSPLHCGTRKAPMRVAQVLPEFAV